MNDPKGGVAKVTLPTFEAMGQIPAFHRKYFLLLQKLYGIQNDKTVLCFTYLVVILTLFSQKEKIYSITFTSLLAKLLPKIIQICKS